MGRAPAEAHAAGDGGRTVFSPEGRQSALPGHKAAIREHGAAFFAPEGSPGVGIGAHGHSPRHLRPSGSAPGSRRPFQEPRRRTGAARSRQRLWRRTDLKPLHTGPFPAGGIEPPIGDVRRIYLRVAGRTPPVLVWAWRCGRTGVWDIAASRCFLGPGNTAQRDGPGRTLESRARPNGPAPGFCSFCLTSDYRGPVFRKKTCFYELGLLRWERRDDGESNPHIFKLEAAVLHGT